MLRRSWNETHTHTAARSLTRARAHTHSGKFSKSFVLDWTSAHVCVPGRASCSRDPKNPGCERCANNRRVWRSLR